MDTRKTRTERREQNEQTLLATHLAEVHLQTQLSGSGRVEEAPGWETIEEFALFRDFHTFVDDDKRPIALYLVFQWQIWKEHPRQ